MKFNRAIVRGLDVACLAVDELAYRPAVVRATNAFPIGGTVSLHECQLPLTIEVCVSILLTVQPVDPSDFSVLELPQPTQPT